ncbi:phospholipase D-like domain-containing protein [Proteocatella sphenisci]|uniref:NgoFVII family restriction endonuclease n=1 Tax=Proteocatella sphenisci TaxID=181070 RepID=UPI00048DD2AE|nr:NgoFVII family restriction endonuclease [Proteocatella sphenisci]
MFYKNQPETQRENYKKMLSIMGNLTLLFSESPCPYLPYRAHENIFCKYLEAENLARFDCSADAKKSKIGIGLKTWMGNDDQKVAEFGKLREKYKDLTGLELIRTIAEYRNERIRVTKNLNGIDEMIYHIVKRIPGAMQIIECAFDYIDIEKIAVIKKRGNLNNTYFHDGKNTYHFSISKNTLYMLFNTKSVLDTFEVEIMTDPYNYLLNLSNTDNTFNIIPKSTVDKENQICLRLYSLKSDGSKRIHEKSGLNQWNAEGRTRDINEIYIPYPVEDRKRNKNFFPGRDVVFNLQLPDGTNIQAKVCQDQGKAIMSNPNKVLGEWLLRKVFELKENTLITYEMLETFGIDSVIFTKESDLNYSIDFAEIGTYEEFYDLEKE